MLEYLFHKLQYRIVRKTDHLKGSGEAGEFAGMGKSDSPAASIPIAGFLDDNRTYLESLFEKSSDIKIREFTFTREKRYRALLLFVDGLADGDLINEAIIEPLMYGRIPNGDIRLGKQPSVPCNSMEDLKNNLLSIGDLSMASNMAEVLSSILYGDTALFVDGFSEAVLISSKKFEKRGVEEPTNETVVRGPKESFNENLRTNTSLLRRKIKDPNLVIETMNIGKRTKTFVGVAYIKGLADPKLIQQIQARLEKIDTDSILESGYIEQYIEDAPFSIFQTIGHTEKPDVLAAKLLEGRVGIFVDGTPFVLTAPLLMVEMFQTAEDYYTKPWFASLLRMMRYMAFFLSVFTPAIYVALTTFHQELLPTSFLFSLASVREELPFTSFVETLIMLLIFEILKEAGLRLPKPIGQTISIVGALVMGEAAVSAGIVGAPLVICVALTAVAGFVVPALNDQGAILRIVFLLLAGFMGGFGITVGFIGLLIHLASLRSFGFAYVSPFLPYSARGIKDTFVRAPLWLMRTRPVKMAENDEVRENCQIPPGEEKQGN